MALPLHVCVFLREDVYSILITQTQHSDKYRNIERFRWENDDLLRILNERINFNRGRANLKKLSNPFSTVFPLTIGASNTDNWLLERTLGRPRELIQFARYYTESVEGDNSSDEVLKSSEQDYSSWKLDDLCAEYSNQYPGLIAIFSYWKTNFFRHKYHLRRAEIEEMLLCIATGVALNEEWFNNIVDTTDIAALLRSTKSVSLVILYRAERVVARRFIHTLIATNLDSRKYKFTRALGARQTLSKEFARKRVPRPTTQSTGAARNFLQPGDSRRVHQA
jgi:hypothetical protein